MIYRTGDLIRKITLMLKSGDLTNTEDRKGLAEQYCGLCEEYHGLISECQTMIVRQMIIEAASFAKSKELEKIGKLLLFPDRDLLLNMCRMYQWPMPEEIRLDVLKDLFSKIAGVRDIAGLVAQYRKIMRSENTEEKIFLLRQICKMDPKPEWKDTLVTFEKEWQNELLNQAKDAIIHQDERKLQNLWEQLSEPGWTVKVPEPVQKKIQNELMKIHQQECDRQAEEICEQISNALSAFDFDVMSDCLNRWDVFLQSENGYTANENLAAQVKDARDWFTAESESRARQRHAEQLISGLKYALDDANTTLEQLDDYVRKLQLMEWKIPEGILDRYNIQRTQILVVRARKRRIVIAGGTAGIILITCFVAWVVHSLTMNWNERSWLTKIEQTIKDGKPEDGLKLLEELAQSSPEIRKRDSILETENKLNALKTEHDGKRKLFSEQMDICRKKLEKYRENSAVIKDLSKKLEKLVLDAPMKQEYDKLLEEIKIADAEDAKESLNEFNRGIERIDDLRKDFFIALDEYDFEKANQCITESEKLKILLSNMKGIDVQTRNANQGTLDRVPELQEKLRERKLIWEEVREVSNALSSPRTSDDFIFALKETLVKYQDKPEMKEWIQFKEDFLPFMEKIKTGGNSILSEFQNEKKTTEEAEKAFQSVYDEIKEDFSIMADGYKRKPVYCILGEDLNNPKLIHGLYYNDLKTKPSYGVRYGKIQFTGLKNEFPGKENQESVTIAWNKQSNGRNVEAIYARDSDRFTYHINRAREGVEVKLLYPADLEKAQLKKSEASHAVKTKEISNILNGSEPWNIEGNLIRSIKILFAKTEPNIHPFPQLTLTAGLCSALAKISADDLAAKLEKDINDKMQHLDLDKDWEKYWMSNSEKARDAYLHAGEIVDSVAEGVSKLKVSGKWINLKFAKEFLSQKFKSIGYLHREKGKWNFVLFESEKDLLDDKELLIPDQAFSKFESIGIYPQSFQKFQLDRKETIIPVFVVEGTSLKDLENKYLLLAKESKVSLKYPKCWISKTGEKQ